MSTVVSLSVSDFVGVLNQTLDFAYPQIEITGELANLRVSRGRWVYFDLKDADARVAFFGTVYHLSGPLEDGMVLAVKGAPRLHPQYGFSVQVQSIRPLGEGSIKKAADLLQKKLQQEGLFESDRKRTLPYPPTHVGLITAEKSAASRDFIKVLNERWGGVRITLIDVQVQGEPAPMQLVAAISQCNQLADAPEVLVVTRGGGSAEDLQAFNTELVTRAVATSRIPTLVAIGHEVDISLAELAADKRASTPSNAAELLAPDRRAVERHLHTQQKELTQATNRALHGTRQTLDTSQQTLQSAVAAIMERTNSQLHLRAQTLEAYNPVGALRRGFALVRKNRRTVHSGTQLAVGDMLDIEINDAIVGAHITNITPKE